MNASSILFFFTIIVAQGFLLSRQKWLVIMEESNIAGQLALEK